MLVEQAIFTSTQTDRAEGYQLVAASPGLSSDDRRELAVWGPSHDSLAYAVPQAASVNFFPLASGLYCISRTITCAAEYSGRGNLRYYTQCLVVPPETFRRFTNNPFAVLRAALAQGTFEPLDEVPPELPSLRLVGRCAAVDHGLLTDLAHDPGTEWLAGALAAMLAEPRLALATSAAQAPRLIAGLLNCLPVECRGQFSFTTGLRLSPRRPFRLVCVPTDPTEIRRAERQHGPVFAIGGQPLTEAADRGWAGYVGEVLRTGRTSTLATALGRPRSIAGIEELDSFGDRLRGELAAGGCTSVEETDQGENATSADSLDREFAHAQSNTAVLRYPRLAEVSDGATAESEPDKGDESAMPALGVSQPQQQGFPSETLELLDRVDDAFFDAIAGKPGAIEQLRTLWPLANERLSPDVLDESKQHYLRQALASWRQGQGPDAVVDASRGVLVLDVLAIVLGD